MCRTRSTSNRRGHRRRALQRYIHDPAESTVRDVPRGSNQGGVESRRSPGAHQVISCWRNPQKESVCWSAQGRHTKVEATTIYAVESMVMPARLPKIDQSAAAFCRHQPQEPHVHSATGKKPYGLYRCLRTSVVCCGMTKPPAQPQQSQKS